MIKRNIFPIIVLLMWEILILWMIDGYLLSSRIYNYLVYKPDCEYVMPKDYTFAKYKNRYVICKEQRVLGKEYLVSYSTSGLQLMYPEIRVPSTFADTCAAKGALKAFLKSTEPIKIEEIEQK